MPTIAELKAVHDASGKKPEEFRVINLGWSSSWYTFYFKAKSRWHGVNAEGEHAESGLMADSWQLWQEPKPRKVVHQWVVVLDDGTMLTTLTWRTKGEAEREFDNVKAIHKLLPGRDAETGEIVE